MSSGKVCDAYIIDTCHIMESGKFQAGAMTYSGRKRVDVHRWDQEFETMEEANIFVRAHFADSGMREAGNEGELRSK